MKFVRCFVLFLALMILPYTYASESLHVVTEQLPPYSYSDDGNVKGIMTAVVRALLSRADVEARIDIYPWARSYKTALEKPNVLIYPIGRTPQRENKFKWLGPVMTTNHYLFALRNNKELNITTLEDAKAYRIGTIRNSLREQFLISIGMARNKQLHSGSSVKAGYEQLKRGKIDLWAANDLVAAYTARTLDVAADEVLVPKVHLQSVSQPYYFAFSVTTPDSIVAQFTKAFIDLSANGALQEFITTETVKMGISPWNQ